MREGQFHWCAAIDVSDASGPPHWKARMRGCFVIHAPLTDSCAACLAKQLRASGIKEADPSGSCGRCSFHSSWPGILEAHYGGGPVTHELNEEYIRKLRRGILEAICEASVPEGGAAASFDKTLYIGTAEVCEVLTITLAEFLESMPGLESPSDIRAVSDRIAKNLKSGIQTIRRMRDETGSDPLPTIAIRPN